MAASRLVANSTGNCSRNRLGRRIWCLSRSTDSPAFTLLETLISMIILTLAVVGLLQALTLALRVYSLTDKHRIETLRRWNRAEQIRMRSAADREPVVDIPVERSPFFNLPDQEGGHEAQWEISDGL